MIFYSLLIAQLTTQNILRSVQRVYRQTLTETQLRTIVCPASTSPTTPSIPSSPSVCQTVWKQCGGINFNGEKCCSGNTECKVLNPWYHQCIPKTSSPVPTVTQVPSVPSVSGNIPISSGTTATLTYFDDNQVQCFSSIPSGNGCAVNPLLLGFTEAQWTSQYLRSSASGIPWCGKRLTLTVNSQTFTCTIIDTCDPVGNPFQSGNQIIGGKCDYTNVIDLYGQTGRNWLLNVVGDDFYQGNVNWKIE